MMIRKLFFLIGIVSLLQACSSSLGVMEIKGTVQASKTDDEDHVVEGYIFDGKTEYHLADSNYKEKLLDQVDAQVRAKGEVTEGWSDGKKFIAVEGFKIIQQAN